MKAIINFLLPVAVVFLAFKMGGPILGLLAIVAALGYIFYSRLPDIYMAIAKLNYQKDNEKALKYMEKAYKTMRLAPEHMIHYAYISLREGRLERSERLINAVLAYKRSPEVRYSAKTNQALLLWKQGKLDEAIETLWEVYENYKTTVVYGNLGYFLILAGDYEKALEFNLEAYDYNSTNEVILDNLAQNYYYLGDYENSEKYFNELMELEPKFPVPYFDYAKTLYALGKKQEAVDALNKALEYNFTFLSAVTKEDVIKFKEEIEASMK